MVKQMPSAGRWTDLENERFKYAKRNFSSWKAIAGFIQTRTADQCRSHNQKMKMNDYVNRSSVPIMYNLCRVHASTQYEPQLYQFSCCPVLITGSRKSSETADSDDYDFVVSDFLFESDI